MITWLNRSGLKWQYLPMNSSQLQEIRMLYRSRLKLFALLIPSLLLICLEAFGIAYGKIKRSLTYEYGTIQNFDLYYIVLCFTLYLALCYVAYRVIMLPIRRDYKKGVFIRYKVKVIGKQYFEHAGKCFLELSALFPYNKQEVTPEQYESTQIGDWIELCVTPYSGYFFDHLGKYYLL